MVIFNSYVSLREGKTDLDLDDDVQRFKHEM
jgi:hypothetical protein